MRSLLLAQPCLMFYQPVKYLVWMHYCLSNAMQCMDSHLCVCVCLYVGHTFCQLTYRSDPQRIFTVDSLTEWVYTRMCLLGVSIMNNDIYGSKAPPPQKKIPFWGLNRHFKPNMRKIQTAISSGLCIRLTWNLTGSCGQQQRLRA